MAEVEVIEQIAEPRPVFSEMAEDIRQMLDFDLCTIWLLNRQEDQFEVVAWSEREGLDPEARHDYDIRLEKETVKVFFDDDQPFCQFHLTPSDVAHNVAVHTNRETSSIAVPIIDRGRIVGMVIVYALQALPFVNQRRKRTFSLMLRAFVDQAAEVIRKEELAKQLQALQEVNQSLAGAFSEDQLIREILTRGLKLVGTNMGWLYLLNPDTNKLVFKDGTGVPDHLIDHERNLGQGITGWVAETGEARLVPDTLLDPHYEATPGLDIKSVVAVPLKHRGKIIGVLTAKSPFRDAFTDDDVTILSSLLTQAAIAIERARLRSHLQQVSHLALTLDFDDLAQYVVQAVRELTGAKVHLWMPSDREEEQGKYLRIVATSGNPDHMENMRTPTVPGSSITAKALKEGRPVIVDDILNIDLGGLPFYNIEEAKEQDWHSFMTVPLIGRDDERLGSLSLYSTTVARFTEADAELMRTFANQVALAMHNAVLFARSEKRRRTLDVLHDTSLIILRQLEFENLLPVIIERAVTLMGGEPGSGIGAAYWRCDYDQNVAVIEYSTNSGFKGFEVGLDEGVISDVLRTEEVQYVNNYNMWKGHPDVFDEEWIEQDDGTRRPIDFVVNLIEAPVIAKEQIIGIIAVTDARGERPFSEADKDPLRRFASLVAVAVQNARLVEHERASRQQAETLRDVSNALTSVLDLREIAGLILDGLRKVVPYKKATMQSIRGDSRDLIAFRGFSEEEIDRDELLKPISEDPLIQRMTRAKRPLILHHTLNDLDWEVKKYTKDVLSWVGVPLIYEGRLVGLLTLDHDQAGFYAGQRVEKPLVAFANQAAIAIQNARRLRDLQIVNSFSQIISTEQDTETLLETIARNVRDKLDCTSCTLFFPERDGDEFWLVPKVQWRSGARPEVITRRFRPGKGVVGWVYEHSKSAVIPNTEDNPHFEPATNEEANRRSMLVVPIISGKRTIGVISADYDALDWFSENDSLLVEALAKHAAIAIEKANLNAQLRVLHQTALNIFKSNQDVQPLLEAIVEEATSLLKAKGGKLYLKVSGEDKLELKVLKGIDPALYPTGRRLKFGEGMAGRVIQKNKPLIVGNYAEYRNRIPELAGLFGALIEVPLPSEGGAIGVLGVFDDTEKRLFDEEQDVSILESLALHASLAIQNADLLGKAEKRKNEAEKREREFRSLFEIGQALTQPIDLKTLESEEFFKSIFDQVNKIIDAPTFFIALTDTEKKYLEYKFFYKRGRSILEELRSRGVAKRALEPEKGLSDYVIQTGDPLAISHYTQQKENEELPVEGIILIPPMSESALYIPLVSGGAIIGVLSAQHDEPNRYDDHDMDLVKAVANSAAVAIDNALRLAELERTTEGLFNSAKAIAAGQIATGFVHEVNNVLNNIALTIHNLKKMIENESGIKKKGPYLGKLQAIETNVEQSYDLAVRLQRLGQRLAPEKKKASLNDIVRLTLELLQSTLRKKDLVLDVKQDPALDNGHFVHVDTGQIGQVIVNLVLNAADASPQGSTISVATTLEEAHAVFKIADSGTGIKPEHLQELFEPFFTTKKDGVGLGLYISKLIIQDNHQGKMDVKSKLGEGTSFSVSLPLDQ